MDIKEQKNTQDNPIFINRDVLIGSSAIRVSLIFWRLDDDKLHYYIIFRTYWNNNSFMDLSKRRIYQIISAHNRWSNCCRRRVDYGVYHIKKKDIMAKHIFRFNCELGNRVWDFVNV